MPGDARGYAGWLLPLAVLMGGCLHMEGEPSEVGRCGPRDLTPECCLKQFPGQWERCTGQLGEASTARSLGAKALAAGTAGAMAVQPVIGTAERRGVELAEDLRTKVEEAIVKCARRADREVNEHHFQGRSPSPELCAQLKQGDTTTWAMYLGAFKHEQAWPCLHEALGRLLPRRYLLHPRFQFNARTGQWEHLSEERERDIVAQQGWTGLTGTIAPDIVLLDAEGVIVRVFDLKFPCPDTNKANWHTYKKGPWFGQSQRAVYEQALSAKASLVSPRWGVSPTE